MEYVVMLKARSSVNDKAVAIKRSFRIYFMEICTITGTTQLRVDIPMIWCHCFLSIFFYSLIRLQLFLLVMIPSHTSSSSKEPFFFLCGHVEFASHYFHDCRLTDHRHIRHSLTLSDSWYYFIMPGYSIKDKKHL